MLHLVVVDVFESFACCGVGAAGGTLAWSGAGICCRLGVSGCGGTGRSSGPAGVVFS